MVLLHTCQLQASDNPRDVTTPTSKNLINSIRDVILMQMELPKLEWQRLNSIVQLDDPLLYRLYFLASKGTVKQGELITYWPADVDSSGQPPPHRRTKGEDVLNPETGQVIGYGGHVAFVGARSLKDQYHLQQSDRPWLYSNTGNESKIKWLVQDGVDLKQFWFENLPFQGATEKANASEDGGIFDMITEEQYQLTQQVGKHAGSCLGFKEDFRVEGQFVTDLKKHILLS